MSVYALYTYKQPPVGFCKTSMNFYQTTQHDMTQDSIDIYPYILLVSVVTLTHRTLV